MQTSSLMPNTETFSLTAFAHHPRIAQLIISKKVATLFKEAVFSKWDVQAIEYKPFLRFAIADLLDNLCDKQLGTTLRSILATRQAAAFVLSCDAAREETAEQSDFDLFLSTAISHLLGLANFDAMHGKYYARFIVENKDNSDSYLRQAHRRLELHNDGTFVEERTDFVLMMKTSEQYVTGGETLLLHLDDWQALEQFYQHPLAKRPLLWGSPKSKNISNKVKHPVFIEDDKDGKPQMLFIDQFAEPQNKAQGLYLYQMSESIENDDNIYAFELPIGAMIVIQNHCWLHGRAPFAAHPKLKRALLRQRGHFTDKRIKA